MSDGQGSDDARSEFLFHHLVAMFQTLALQQLGKLVNPITGKMERDLQQARITIDMIQMIQEKTRGNLSDDEKRLIDNVLMELQMNFVDERSREGAQRETNAAEEKTERKSASQQESVSQQENAPRQEEAREETEQGNAAGGTEAPTPAQSGDTAARSDPDSAGSKGKKRAQRRKGT